MAIRFKEKPLALNLSQEILSVCISMSKDYLRLDSPRGLTGPVPMSYAIARALLACYPLELVRLPEQERDARTR